MNQIEFTSKTTRPTMPRLWQICAFVLLFLIAALLFIDDPLTKYSIDITVSILNIVAVVVGFYLCKKSAFPWGFLASGIIIISSSFIINSLIFFGFDLNTQLSLWLEVLGITLISFFSANLLYAFEKQYKLKGITIDYILIALSVTFLVFLISPNLLTTVTQTLSIYEQSLVFNVVIGTLFFSLITMGYLLSKKIKRSDLILGSMALSLSMHFYLDAFITFSNLSNVWLIESISWFLYQLPGVLAIFYIFADEQKYNFKPNQAKNMGVKLLWIATVFSVLIVPTGVILRWLLDFKNINTLTIAVMSVVLGLLVIWRIINLISNYEKQRQKLKNIAFTDPLTGISNYLGLQTHIANLNNIFVLILNIEDFKSINDMYDRKFGDEVLRSLAKRITKTSGVLYSARTTGDNFLAVLQVEERNIYSAFVTIQEEIGLWDTVFNRRVAIPITYGGSHSVNPEHIDILVSQAEQALKKSREQKRQFTLHKTLIDSPANNLKQELPRHELREILQRSVDQNELPIHFQPIYEIGSGELKALELLIRVDSLKYGLLMPGQFLEQAKSYGLLTDLTYTCVCMIAKNIHRLPDVMININVPPYMLDNRETLRNFITFFNSKKLDPSRFCIEVTEDGDIPAESLIPAVNLLKEAGFAIAMDDFGTGYSSLGRLSSLPFDTVKIDRSLLLAADNGNKTILESAITLVKRLGVSVVVEGIETLDQLSLVRELGADAVQGYLFSKPVPVINKKQFALNAVDIVSEF